jgi:predicted  nucleic acid-binding Zn-ribbon protein
MSDEQQAALAARDARIAELEAGWDAETVKRQVADFNKLCDEIRRLRDDLAAREAELAILEEARDHWAREFGDADERADKAESELREAKEHQAKTTTAWRKAEEQSHVQSVKIEKLGQKIADYVSEVAYQRARAEQAEAALAALATPPRRTPEGER